MDCWGTGCDPKSGNCITMTPEHVYPYLISLHPHAVGD